MLCSPQIAAEGLIAPFIWFLLQFWQAYGHHPRLISDSFASSVPQTFRWSLPSHI